MNIFETKHKEERKILERFLSISVNNDDEIFDIFKNLPNATYRQGERPNERFVYIRGTRDDKVLLVAHADTVWDKNWIGEDEKYTQKLGYSFGIYYNKNSFLDFGIGADDRAGCAILYLLRNSGHSILIVDGEEHCQVGSKFLKNANKDIFDEINNHCYALQFDRRNKRDYKCYNIPVEANFKEFIEKNLEFSDAGKNSKTDIVVLCDKICGANLSVGYYNEHTRLECLDYKDWLKNYINISQMLENKQIQFNLNNLDKEEEDLSK